MRRVDHLDPAAQDLVLAPDGVEFGADQAATLLSLWKQRLEATTGGIVYIDLRAVHRIDSTGLSLLVGLARECQRLSRPMQVAIAHSFVRRVIQVMHLDRHLDIVWVGPEVQA